MPTRVDQRPLRFAPLIPLDRSLVESLILSESDRLDLTPEERATFEFTGDERFRRAWIDGLASLPMEERRGILSVRTGQIAEAAAETMMVDIGYIPVHHFRWAGTGVDLIMMNAATDALLAVEVKGTLCPGRWPRLRSSRTSQFTKEWLRSPQNVGMRDVGLDPDDLYGLILLVNFADMACKAAFTSDFKTIAPVTTLDDLNDLVPN